MAYAAKPISSHFHHATNAIAYAIQKFIPESKGKTIKRHRENSAESFPIRSVIILRF
jgi:hypothetical protein